ncbi:hypothetical protein LZ32DRAFT_67221 [Colletotrichum eremochloae]|nr:hypothetical protein LZ32DRAFT_67221 [Colletotrichum eremochloae]
MRFVTVASLLPMPSHTNLREFPNLSPHPDRLERTSLKKIIRAAWSCAKLEPPNLGDRHSIAAYDVANYSDGALYLGRRLFLDDVSLFNCLHSTILASLVFSTDFVSELSRFKGLVPSWHVI